MWVLVVMVMMVWIKKKKFDVNNPMNSKRQLSFLSLVEVEAEILESNIDEVQLQRLRNGERPGALWHLFRSDDAKKIREYIGRVCLFNTFSIENSTLNLFARLTVEHLVRIRFMIKRLI